MTTPEHLVWFIATAVMTLTVLTVGTLGAADLLRRPPAAIAESPGLSGEATAEAERRAA